MSPALANDDATLATERVLEGVVALGKAELRLAGSELRAWLEKAFFRVFFAAGLLWLAACVTQVAIALICVSPLLLTFWSVPMVLLSTLLSTGVGVLLAILGVSRMRGAFRRDPPARTTDTTPLCAAETFPARGSANAE
jgi:hypothetical protein